MNPYDIALGALLHDIGKFMQRAYNPDDGLSPQSRNMAPFICPQRDGRPTHLHVLYTNEFLERLHFLPDGLDKSLIANLACYHHRPDDQQHAIIRDADCLASGMERQPESDDGYDQQQR